MGDHSEALRVRRSPRSPRPRSPRQRAVPIRKAFTLLELLVVIAIVAILSAVLFPVFAQAKAAGKKTVALSNLRSIGLAWTLYASADDDVLMPPRTPSGPRRFRYWWTEWDETLLRANPREGLLFPFTREEGIQADPAFPNRLRAATGMSGFGYNYRYLGTGRVSATAIADPSGTVAFATSAQIDFRAPFALQGNTYLEAPSARYPTFHARHSGVGLVLWADGHVAARRPVFRTDLRPERARPAALGEIARGPLDDSLFDLD